MLFFRMLLLIIESCVAAIGALHFSVRSFGCALFVYTTQEEKRHEEKTFKHGAYGGADAEYGGV